MGTRRERRPGARTRNPWRGLVGLAVLTCAVTGASCGNVITPKYEYEEDVYLALDGSATVYVNDSGEVLSAGVAPPDETGESASDCIATALLGVRARGLVATRDAPAKVSVLIR